jgi:hypothetical protein
MSLRFSLAALEADQGKLKESLSREHQRRFTGSKSGKSAGSHTLKSRIPAYPPPSVAARTAEFRASAKEIFSAVPPVITDA